MLYRISVGRLGIKMINDFIMPYEEKPALVTSSSKVSCAFFPFIILFGSGHHELQN